MEPVNFVFRPFPQAKPFDPLNSQCVKNNPLTLFECSRRKVKSSLLTHLSAEWKCIWTRGQLKTFRSNFIEFAGVIQKTLDFLSFGNQIPLSISDALDLTDDLRKICYALDANAPWTRFMEVTHPSNAKQFAHPRFFARIYVLFCFGAFSPPFSHAPPGSLPISVETWVGMMGMK